VTLKTPTVTIYLWRDLESKPSKAFK